MQDLQTTAGCDSVTTFTLQVLSKPSVTASSQDLSCFGVADGVITLDSPDPDIQYSLNGGPFQSRG